MPVAGSNQHSDRKLQARHEGFKLSVEGLSSGKLSVEPSSESNSMSQQNPVEVPANLGAKPRMETPVAHYLGICGRASVVSPSDRHLPACGDSTVAFDD